MSRTRKLYKISSILFFICVSFIMDLNSQDAKEHWKDFKEKHGGKKVKIKWDPITRLPAEISNFEFYPPSFVGIRIPKKEDITKPDNTKEIYTKNGLQAMKYNDIRKLAKGFGIKGIGKDNLIEQILAKVS